MRLTLLAAPALLCAAVTAQAQDVPATTAGQEALAILTEAIEVPTVAGRGEVPRLAALLTDRLVQSGFAQDDVSFVPLGETGYLTARYSGRDRSAGPIVVLAHMDVVEARAEDWERDPFTAVVEDGFVFGRGALDNKADLSMVMAALMGLKREGWIPARDIVLLFTGDEETQMRTTAAAAKAFANAALVLNADSGGGQLDADGKPFVYTVQAGEKTYADYRLTLTDAGGHSSRPDDTNPIVDMSAALSAIGAYQFPPKLSPLTKAYFEGTAATASPEIAAAMQAYAADPADQAAIATLSARPEYVGQVRTTCVPTMVEGGHAPNALPQSIRANVNCRIFPGTSRAEVMATLTQVIGNPAIAIEFIDNGTLESIESPLQPEIMAAIRAAVEERAPGLPVVPGMSAGATDSMHFRAQDIPALGVGATFIRAEDGFAHGLNERLPLATLDPGVQQWRKVLTTIAR
ncbi:M20/M25/M40 family metallo-hydrolase [Croceibacterium sp. TMG7-5b_MA50]|uniref:M20/M25/M40 family metallo-hydrolase n=1 Tax=Croceibacterium sp. TMG7-5b_MA50 TaxID=3121290 RepID=UPI0032218072